MKAQFFDIDSNPGPVVRLVDGIAIPDEDAKRVLDEIVIVEPRTFALLTYTDGERYLRALPYTFRTPYHWIMIFEGDDAEQQDELP